MQLDCIDFHEFVNTNLYAKFEDDKVKLKRETRYNSFDNQIYFLEGKKRLKMNKRRVRAMQLRKKIHINEME